MEYKKFKNELKIAAAAQNLINKIIIIIWRAPGPCGACPTQPYKCGQNVKINVKIPPRGLPRKKILQKVAF